MADRPRITATLTLYATSTEPCGCGAEATVVVGVVSGSGVPAVIQEKFCDACGERDE